MADILIKGVEMPSKCGGCPFNYREQSYNGKPCGVRDGDTLYDRTTYDTNHLCFITNAPIEDNLRYKTRNENCPLIPVPEHNELADKSVIIERMENAYDELYDKMDEKALSECHVAFLKAVMYAPTVLERTT